VSAPFQPGDVVVCVDDGPNPFGGLQHGLRVRQCYRIEAAFDDIRVQLPLVLVFGRRSLDHTGAYLASRFRKIDAEVTEAFREQLRKLPVRERVS
jgi:hypothetical protein